MALSQATSTGTIPTTASFLGALPTTFSAPTTCGTTTYTWITDRDTTVWELAPQTSDDPTCLPSNWVVDGYYSPGLCPYGYTNACSMTANDVETTICCPTNQIFACHSTLAYGKFVCSSSVPSTIMTVAEFARRDDISAEAVTEIHFSTRIVLSDGLTISDSNPSISTASAREPQWLPYTLTPVPVDTIISSGGNPNSDSSLELTAPLLPSYTSFTLTSRTTQFPGHTLWAYSIQIQKAASISSVPATPSNNSTTSSSTTSVSSPSISGSPSTPPLSTSALPQIAVVGIAVGVIGALVLGATVSYLFMRRRKVRNIPPSPRFPPVHKSAHRFLSNSLHELDEQRNASEMPGWDERYSRGPNRPMAWELPAQRNALEMSVSDERNRQGANKPEAWELPA
ncbi:hypothetical protein F5Y05DRAFT_65436 [Hypoxylon sp. FL0543]|nr:hypothetical protein F5Y05DRAFT_65436 [Hypoxylon sp. FL0543]